MSISIHNIKELHKSAEMLKAMAHPIRILILGLLGKNGQMNVTDIYEELKIEQAAASHHLNLLKTKGLLQSIRQGKNCYYQLKHQNITQIINCIEQCKA